MSDTKFEKTNPELALPDEKRAADDTGPIEGASAGARQFRKAAVIASQTREDADSILSPAPKEKTPPEGTLRISQRRISTTSLQAVVVPTSPVTEEPITAKRPSGAHATVDISDSAQAAKDHAREAQEILRRGKLRAEGKPVDPTHQFKIMKPGDAEVALENSNDKEKPRRTTGAIPVVPKEKKEEAPTGKGFFQKALDILVGEDKKPDSEK